MARVIEVSLRAHGYTPFEAGSGHEALATARVVDLDLVILDLGLPDIDGLAVYRALRSELRVPIMVVTADGSEQRLVSALDFGADDYLTKPFSLPELMARVRVALRHRRVLSAVADDQVVRCGPLVLDTGGHQALLGAIELQLTRRQFALLAMLMRNAGRVLTHGALIEAVWGSGQNVGTLRTHVNQLRRKLETHPEAPKIVSEPAVGYRLLTAESGDRELAGAE